VVLGWRVPRDLQEGTGQDLADRGLPVCSSDGEAATDGGTEEFIIVRWAPTTSDILGELLQFEEGRGR
jgi:hypothetical protein